MEYALILWIERETIKPTLFFTGLASFKRLVIVLLLTLSFLFFFCFNKLAQDTPLIKRLVEPSRHFWFII